MTNPNAWTAKDVELLILEAAETLQRCPNVPGPVWSLPSMWSEYKDGYAHPKRTKVNRILPDGKALSRMETVWGWINEIPDEDIRRVLHGSSRAKVRKGDTIQKFAMRTGVSRKTVRRKFEQGCSIIAYNLNQKKYLQLTMSQNSTESRANHLQSKKYALHWMAPGGRPSVHPDLSKSRLIQPKRKARAKREKQDHSAR